MHVLEPVVSLVGILIFLPLLAVLLGIVLVLPMYLGLVLVTELYRSKCQRAGDRKQLIVFLRTFSCAAPSRNLTRAFGLGFLPNATVVAVSRFGLRSRSGRLGAGRLLVTGFGLMLAAGLIFPEVTEPFAGLTRSRDERILLESDSNRTQVRAIAGFAIVIGCATIAAFRPAYRGADKSAEVYSVEAVDRCVTSALEWRESVGANSAAPESRWGARMKRRFQTHVGLLVLHCPQSDASWKDAVTWLLVRADAVIIDVSDIHGPGLRWEIEEAQRICPKRVVLVAARAALRKNSDTGLELGSSGVDSDLRSVSPYMASKVEYSRWDTDRFVRKLRSELTLALRAESSHLRACLETRDWG